MFSNNRKSKIFTAVITVLVVGSVLIPALSGSVSAYNVAQTEEALQVNIVDSNGNTINYSGIIYADGNVDYIAGEDGMFIHQFSGSQTELDFGGTTHTVSGFSDGERKEITVTVTDDYDTSAGAAGSDGTFNGDDSVSFGTASTLDNPSDYGDTGTITVKLVDSNGSAVDRNYGIRDSTVSGTSGTDGTFTISEATTFSQDADGDYGIVSMYFTDADGMGDVAEDLNLRVYESKHVKYTVTDNGDQTYSVAESVINEPPTADAGSALSVDSVDTAVSFDGTNSSDPDGDSLSYSWNIQSTDSVEDMTGSNPSYTFSEEGTYQVELTVSDGEFTASDTVEVTVGDTSSGDSSGGAFFDSNTDILGQSVSNPVLIIVVMIGAFVVVAIASEEYLE
ncbi:PKD domain-containing protein [Haloferax larsenii]|uniref:PKD domain-containing protein n=1 Tax=Haloferax larsenii TaxID=302484 RepID=A0A1H7QQU6_HALLR|nr:PKD domain-containing protein [Haloferax larsenii]SEL50370.1 PKD domain-containing protein [Haloferax larsenii]